MAAEAALAILARAPIPGAAKSRLIPRLGAEGAAALHARLVRRTVETMLGAALGHVTVWCTPSVDDPFFRKCAADYGVTLAQQTPGDLGDRMAAVFAAATPAILVGTDCPVLSPVHVRSARAALDRHDAVFLPAEDGGYVVVGLRQPVGHLFTQMAWGADTVMNETRRRLGELGLSWAEPATLWDVDRPADYDRLIAENILG